MARSAALAVQTPGAMTPPDDAEADVAASDQAARIAALEAELAAAKRASALPSPVYEPVTPHGEAALRASPFAKLTVAELIAKIDAGEVREPVTAYLCSDGYYTRRG